MGQQMGSQAFGSMVSNPCVARRKVVEPEDDVQRLALCLRRADALILEPDKLQRECDFHFRRGGLDANGLMRRVELRRLLWTFAHGLGSSRLTWEAIEASAVIGTLEPEVPVVTHEEFFRCVLKTVHLVAAELRGKISEVEEAFRREQQLKAEAAAKARPANPWAALAQQHAGAGSSSCSSRSSSCSSRASDPGSARGHAAIAGSDSQRREGEAIASGAEAQSASGKGKGRGKGRIVSRGTASARPAAAPPGAFSVTALEPEVPVPITGSACATAAQQDWLLGVAPTPPAPTVAPRLGTSMGAEAWGPFPSRPAVAVAGASAAAPAEPPSPLLAPAPAGGMGALLLPYPKPAAPSLGAGRAPAQAVEEELGCIAAPISPGAAAPAPGASTKAEVQLLNSEGTWDPHVLSVSHGALLLQEVEPEEPTWGQHFLGGHDEGDVFDLSILVTVLSGEGLLRSPAVSLLPGLAAQGHEAWDRMLLLSFAEDEVLFLSLASVEDCQRCFRAIQHEAGMSR